MSSPYGAKKSVPNRWYAILDFVDKLGLPKRQIRRDYLEGGLVGNWVQVVGGSWTRHRNGETCGKRGGGRGIGKPHVRVGVMKELFQKCYSNLHLRL